MANIQGKEVRSHRNQGANRHSAPVEKLGNIPEDGTWRPSNYQAMLLNGGSHSDLFESTSQSPANESASLMAKKKLTEEDLKWRLRYAHLYPELTVDNWIKDIKTVCMATDSFKPYASALRNLREYPFSIQDKLALSSKLRDKLAGISPSNFKTMRRRSLATKELRRSIQRKTSNSLGFSVSGFSPYTLWGDTIGRIAAYFGTNVASYFNFLRFLVIINALMGVLMFCFVSLPQIIDEEVYNDEVISGFFGELSKTIFFFGAYSNNTIGKTVTYKRPLAYLMTWCGANVLAVLIIVVSMYVKYRQIKGYSLGDSEPYSKLFYCWDYSITHRKGVEKMKGFIIHYFRESKKEESFQKNLTDKQKCRLWFLRILCILLSIGALGGSAYLIYYVASNTIKPGKDVPSVISDFFKKYQLTVLVSGLKVVVPPVLSLLLYIERYHPRTEIKVQIARTAVFYVASLVVFLASVYSVSNKCMTDNPSGSNSTNLPYCCWENEVGEQLFQMVILDLVFCLVVDLVITGGQFLVYKTGITKRIGKPDFKVANLILELVYGQSLIWLGLYAAPFFALIALVKLIIIFYFYYGLAKLFCEPNNIFRASRSGTFYLFILLATLFVCLFPMTYAIIKLKPSNSCGPFQINHRVYEVLTNEIGASPEWLQAIIQFASTAAVIVPLLIILLLLVIYYKARSDTLHRETKELRHHLDFGRKEEKRKIYENAQRLQGISISSGLNEIGRMSASAALAPLNMPDQDAKNRPLPQIPFDQLNDSDDDETFTPMPQSSVSNSREPDADYEQPIARPLERGSRNYSSDSQIAKSHSGQGYMSEKFPQEVHPGYRSDNNAGYLLPGRQSDHYNPMRDLPLQRSSSSRSVPREALPSGSMPQDSFSGVPSPSNFHGIQRPQKASYLDPIHHDERPDRGHYNPVYHGEPEEDFHLRSRSSSDLHLENQYSPHRSNFY